MVRYLRLILVLLIAAVAFYFYSCRNNDLRGWWKSSHDGKTYLVVEDLDGAKPDGNPCTLDGKPWPYKKGERGEVSPGVHELGCPAKVGFKIQEGVEYHFDYWGP